MKRKPQEPREVKNNVKTPQRAGLETLTTTGGPADGGPHAKAPRPCEHPDTVAPEYLPTGTLKCLDCGAVYRRIDDYLDREWQQPGEREPEAPRPESEDERKRRLEWTHDEYAAGPWSVRWQAQKSEDFGSRGVFATENGAEDWGIAELGSMVEGPGLLGLVIVSTPRHGVPYETTGYMLTVTREINGGLTATLKGGDV